MEAATTINGTGGPRYGSLDMEEAAGNGEVRSLLHDVTPADGSAVWRNNMALRSMLGRELEEQEKRNAVLAIFAITLLGLSFIIGMISARIVFPYPTSKFGTFLPQDVSTDFTLMHFTDVHVEPLYDRSQVSKGSCRNDACCDSKKHTCELFTYNEAEAPTLGCDPPIQLLDNSLAAMKAIDPNTNYLVFTGDMVAHHLCSEEIVRETQTEFFRRVTKVFPKTPLVYGIGNNDLWPNNRNSRDNFMALYEIMEQECSTCAMFLYDPRANKATFTEGGYYYYRDTHRMVTHIVLNSGLWSPRYDNTEMPIQAADDHMNWLAAQLAGARVRGDRVIISSHIPPGHVRHSMDWAEPFLNSFINLCNSYRDLIMGQFYGHHSKEYIRSFSNTVGVLVSSGMTPLGGGSLILAGAKDPANPTFQYGLFTRKVFYDMWTFYLDLSAGQPQGGQIRNPENFYTPKLAANMQPQVDDLPQGYQKSRFARAQLGAAQEGWRLMYSFRETYKVEDVSAHSIYIASQRILHDSKYTTRYEAFLSGLHSNERLIACDVSSLSPQSHDVEVCRNRMCLLDVSQTCTER